MAPAVRRRSGGRVGARRDPEADLELRLSAADQARRRVPRRAHRRRGTGRAGRPRTRRAAAAGPPLDIREVPELAALPPFPGASLVVQSRLAAGPFGPASVWMAFDDGRCSGVDLGETDRADVLVEMACTRMAAARRGEITILEALEGGGGVEGDLGPLMLLAGLEESDELRVAERACGAAGTILGQLGALATTAEHRAAMAELASRTP